MTAEILEKQTADVDSVSGATYSSRGIMEAVRNALTGQKEEEDDTVTIGQGSFKLKNGVYQGSGNGFRGTVSVAVVIKDASVIAIEPYDYADDDAFFTRAKEGVTAEILEKQTTDADSVSGATYSSNGIRTAVKDALEKGKNSSKTEDDDKKDSSKTDSKITYQDGTYTGSADGFSGKVKVKVRIKNGKIKKITIVSHSDGAEYMDKAKILAKRIVSAQSTGVDTVSGATCSSNGIIHAVQNALKKAVKEKKQEDSSDTKDPQEETPATVTGNFDYADGIYPGTGEGYGGDIKVSVVIQDKTIKAILITDHAGEDDSFFNRAKTITASMVASQTTDVDSVSGATYSSRGIIEAVRAAMEAAKNGNTQDSGNTDRDKQPEDTKDPVQDTDTSKENMKDFLTRWISLAAVLLVLAGYQFTLQDRQKELEITQLKQQITQMQTDTEWIDRGETDTEEDAENSGQGARYVDGTYEGEGQGFGGTIRVQLTVADGRISEIHVVSAEKEDSSYLAMAEDLLPAILQNQSADVDTISGATYSSTGIKKAASQALAQAQK